MVVLSINLVYLSNYRDKQNSGHFVTETQVDHKVQHMINARHALLDRLESQAQQAQVKSYIAPHKEAKKQIL